MTKMTTLTLMFILGFGAMAQTTVQSEESTLYKHDEARNKVTQGFVDPKVAMDKHSNSIPKEPINKVIGEHGLNLNNRIKDATQPADTECNSTDWCQ